MSEMLSSSLDDTLEGLPVHVVDVSNLWSTLCIAKTIPLGRLEWIWNVRSTSIRESSLSAKAVFNLTDSLTIPETTEPECAQLWFRKPYFYLLLIPISDLDTPKDSSGWSRVRKFVNACRSKSVEYIVAVIASDTVARQQRKLLERLRAEVNIFGRGRERVVTVPSVVMAGDQNPITHLYNSPSHQDLLIRLRECSRMGVESRIQKYENELARLLTNRAAGSWSFCYFFSVKEAMGFLFCQLGRRDIALRLLDELHSVMVEADEKEGTRPFCTESPCDAATNVTNVNGKDFHKLFKDESITEMEMRTYLFARQTEIMLPDRKFADIAERGLKLITAISRRCIEESAKEQSLTSTCFRDAWVFTASRALASTLAPAIPASAPDTTALTPQLATPKERHTARLIAGFHVHALKAFLGLTNVVLPGAMAHQKEAETCISDEARKELLDFFNEELRDALSNSHNAEILYSVIANAAASLYEMGGRSRGAAALDGDAGVIRLRNGSLSEAEKLLKDQCSRFTDDHGWDELHQRKRKELARVQKQLGNVQEYLVSCLSMLVMTRSARSIDLVPLSSNTQSAARKEQAVFWSKEAYEAAAQLPRVMKYKIEKLVTVSVRRNTKNWCEGDAAEAVVVIESDIPAELQFDSLFLELKSALAASADNKAPSALHGEKTTTATSTRSSTTLTLKSKGGGITVRPGTNEVSVFTSEVLWSGRYTVSLVAMFIGNLKLFQVAPRLEASATVFMRGSSSHKESSHKSSSATPPSELGKGAVRFPCFYAKSRSPVASLTVRQDCPIYLVQGLLQVVQIDIKSEEYGIAKGASIHVNLSFDEDKGIDDNHSLLEFLDFSKVTSGALNNQVSLSAFSFQSKPSKNDGIEAIINEDIPVGTNISARLSLQVPQSLCSWSLEQKSGVEAECVLTAALCGRELSSASKRGFECSIEQPMSILSPVSFTTHSDVNTKSGDVVTVPHNLNDSFMSEGGTLVCTLQSRVVRNRTITLQSARLDLPFWLQHCEGEDSPHADLLPCTVSHGCRFLFAFDIDVCANEPHPHSLRESLSSVSESLSHRRYVRQSMDFKTSEEDHERDNKPPLSSENVGKSRDVTTNKDGADESIDLEGVSSEGGLVAGQGDLDMTDDVEMEDVVEPMQTTSPEIGDVVDLSSSMGEKCTNMKNPYTPLALSEQDLIGTLKVDFSIEGVDGTAQVEHIVSLTSFIPQPRLYHIHRNCPENVVAGEAVELSFWISVARSVILAEEENSDRVEVLQYEIEADPIHWIVAGRKRGRIEITRGTSNLGRATILPLMTGRVLVPTVRLYTESGDAVAENSLENLNECMQVVVFPCSNVTTVCKQRKTNSSDGVFGGNLNGAIRRTMKLKAHMPAVVTFDSFFDT